MSDYRPGVEELIVATQKVKALGVLTYEEARAVADAMESLLVSIPDSLEE
jgi:hypothetical protein